MIVISVLTDNKRICKTILIKYKVLKIQETNCSSKLKCKNVKMYNLETDLFKVSI